MRCEWQVNLARERKALQVAEMETSDQYILVGIVLPTMARYITQFQPIQMMINLYRNYSPRFLRSLMSNAANAVLFLLDNRWMNSIAFILTKLIRSVLCFAAFGIDEGDKAALKQAILNTVDPRGHFPIITLVVETCVNLLGCVGSMMSSVVGIIKCAKSLIYPNMKLPGYLEKFVSNVTIGIFELCGAPGQLLADEMRTFLSLYEEYSSVFGGVGTAIHLMISHKEVGQKKRAAKITLSLRKDFERFYGFHTYTITAGIFLHVARHINAEKVLSVLFTFMSVVPMIATPLHALLLSALKQLRETVGEMGVITLHRVVVFVMEGGLVLQNTENVFEILGGFCAMLQCAAVVFLNILGNQIGWSMTNRTEKSSCCAESLLRELQNQNNPNFFAKKLYDSFFTHQSQTK